MRFFIGMGLIGSTVRSWQGFILTGILAFMGLVIPAQIVHADICALCEDRPHVCSPETLASCRRDKSDKSPDTTRSSENSDGRDRSPCGPNPPDKGFVYSTGDGNVRSDPSASSNTVGQLARGGRFIYDRIINSGGKRWYHINPPSSPQGWVPSSDVACTRPTVPPPPRPNHVKDCDIPLANTSSAQGGSRGFGSGECQQDPTQQEPVSFR
jgi:hypothetical protein